MCRFKVGEIVYLLDAELNDLKEKKYLRVKILSICEVEPNLRRINPFGRQHLRRLGKSDLPIFLLEVVFEGERGEFNDEKGSINLLSTRFGTKAEAVAARVLDED